MAELLDEEKTRALSINCAYQTLCNQSIIDLRNAFSHSQYLLVPNKGDVALTKWFAKTSPANKKGQFKFSEIQDIFRRTTTFLTVLAHSKKRVLKEYLVNESQ